MRHRQPCVSLFAAFIVARFFCLSAMAIGAETTAKTIQTVPGMPAVVDPKNLYSETRSGQTQPGRGETPASSLCAQSNLQRCLGDRSRNV